MNTPTLILNDIINTVIKLHMQSMKNAATPFSQLNFSRLHLRNALCSTTPSIPLSSSIHTWQLHQRPHPLPLLSRARQFDGLCPLFARNKNICSVKCFCKWRHGLMGCRATGVQVVWSLMMDWFQFIIWFLRERHQFLFPGCWGCSRSWLRVHPLN